MVHTCRHCRGDSTDGVVLGYKLLLDRIYNGFHNDNDNKQAVVSVKAMATLHSRSLHEQDTTLMRSFGDFGSFILPH